MPEATNFLLNHQRQPEKRACQRIEVNRSVQLKLVNGNIINGLTDDVSLSGLKVITRDSLENTIMNKHSNQVALLQVILSNGHLSSEFPCSIIRYESGAICLQLDQRRSEKFGRMMSKGSFRGMS